MRYNKAIENGMANIDGLRRMGEYFKDLFKKK